MVYMSEEYGTIDLGLHPGELITGLQNFNGKLYAFTDRRVFLIKRKTRMRLFRERLARICSSFRS